MDANEIYNYLQAFKLLKHIRKTTKSKSAPAVYQALASFARHSEGRYKGKCWPSLPTICNESGLCRRTVLNSITLLEQHDFIEIRRGRKPDGTRRGNRYTLPDLLD